jgi:hypothetical protein
LTTRERAEAFTARAAPSLVAVRDDWTMTSNIRCGCACAAARSPAGTRAGT